MSLAERLRADIGTSGPMPVERWMAACNAHYYATRDPLGRDFTTAPEISQMFGELVGLCLADAWQRAGSPPGVRLVELGPGRGTLMADLLRATRRVPRFAPMVHFVETSPVLRAAQAERVPGATWHDTLAEMPDDGPLLLVANEFFDALPIRQVFDDGRERVILRDGTRFVSPAGRINETSPTSLVIAVEIGARLRTQGGAALIIDYGYSAPATGDTLQAMRDGKFADPFADPGEVDLTAHVDFTALADSAGVTAQGPVGQGAWLRALGIESRAATLRAAGDESVDAAAARLTGEAEMGTLFQVLGLTSAGWSLAGFAA